MEDIPIRQFQKGGTLLGTMADLLQEELKGPARAFGEFKSEGGAESDTRF